MVHVAMDVPEKLINEIRETGEPFPRTSTVIRRKYQSGAGGFRGLDAVQLPLTRKSGPDKLFNAAQRFEVVGG